MGALEFARNIHNNCCRNVCIHKDNRPSSNISPAWMPRRILYEGSRILSLKPAHKKEAMDYTRFIGAVSIFNSIRHFIYQRALIIIDSIRKMDGNVWIWSDGRSSVVAPSVESDKHECWYYDALTNRLSLCVPEATVSVVRRLPWITVTLEQGENTMDITDYLTGMTYQSPFGTIPSIMIIRTLLTQKLGVYVGGTATFRVFCRSDLLEEKVFGADLEEEEDIENWNCSWE